MTLEGIKALKLGTVKLNPLSYTATQVRETDCIDGSMRPELEHSMKRTLNNEL